MLDTLTVVEQALAALAQSFDTDTEPETVLRTVFDWYYVPRSSERRAYRDRVINETLTHVDLQDEATWPDWFWRVHAIRANQQTTGEGSISPPPDPKI